MFRFLSVSDTSWISLSRSASYCWSSAIYFSACNCFNFAMSSLILCRRSRYSLFWMNSLKWNGISYSWWSQNIVGLLLGTALPCKNFPVLFWLPTSLIRSGWLTFLLKFEFLISTERKRSSDVALPEFFRPLLPGEL